ncbi:MAG: hypothetical protein QXV09_04900 [Candidatus Bathyarchaeia archaeon]
MVQLKRIQKFLLPAVLVMATAFLIFAPYAQSVDALIEEKALSFIKEVVQLDLSKYDVKNKDYFEEYLDHTVKKDVTCSLKSAEGNLTVICQLANSSLYYCVMYVDEGKAFYIQPLSTIFDRAIGILERYKKWMRDESLNEMISTLKMVDGSENVTMNVGDWQFKFLITSQYVKFSWMYIPNKNKILFPNCLIISFAGNNFYFVDERSLYKIGNTDVTVSQTEAISIALKYLENYSFEVFMGGQSSIIVQNFTIVKEKITTELLSWPREDGAQYPYWKVDLPLDKLYPGNKYTICVNVWADTGEVFAVYH